MNPAAFDNALIIDGGSAGSTMATLLAEPGRRFVLLGKNNANGARVHVFGNLRIVMPLLHFKALYCIESTINLLPSWRAAAHEWDGAYA